ncbi:MAG: histidine kinase [Saprospiraceae bacterium]
MIKKHKAMLRYHFCISYLILVILLPLSTLAQVSPYKNYTVADGLLSNKVFAICQDSTGYMYFATDRGISVFNGHSFKNFTVKEGMPTNIYYGLYKDKWNRVWAQSTSDQLIAFKDGEIEKIYKLPKVCRQVNFFENEFGIYIQIDYGTYFFENIFMKKNRIIDLYKSLNNFPENKNSIFNNNKQIILSKDNIYLKDILSDSLTLYPDIKVSKYLKTYLNKGTGSFYNFKKNIIYLRDTTHEILIYNEKDNNILLHTTLNKLLNSLGQIYTPYIKNDYFYIETSKGYIQIDSNINITTFKYPINNYEVEITRSHIDKDNNLWIGTSNAGCYLITPSMKSIKNLPKLNKEHGNYNIINGSDNIIFVGTSKGNIYLYTNNNLKKIAFLGDYPIHTIDIKKKTTLLANALNVYEFNYTSNSINKDYIFNLSNSLKPNDQIFSKPFRNDGNKFIFRSNDEKVLFIARVSDLLKIKQNDEKNFKTKIIYDGIVENIKQTKSGFTIILLNNKLYQIDNLDQIQPLLLNNELIFKTYAIDNNDDLWLGTEYDGIWKFSKNCLEKVYPEINSSINNIFIDNKNNKYFSTNSGIFIARENQDRNLIEKFSHQDGILNKNILGLFANSENIYAISDDYFTIIPNYPEIGKYFLTPKLKIFANNAILDTTVVNIVNNTFSFIMESLDFSSLGESKFHYMLEGFDEEWKITKNTEINYALTKPGTYTFRCKLENYKGQISPNESTMLIILLPRWYETLFFRILGIIILVSMLTGSIQFVLKRKKKTEKARLMADRQISDVKLESLRAQMNPHFVFNAMGSIQNLIQNDQKDLADTYLSRFSRLLRLYLESSKNEDILLKDEIQLITKYLEIEKLRFKNRLDFKIMVQPSELDTSTVKIPSLLLQPIIENALGHGLFHKEGGGLISILIEEKVEGLKIIIEDDGIGRAKAAQMKTQTSNSHISRGLEMMKDRISLVNKKGNYLVTLEYHDLIKDSIPLGTRVILKIK